MSQNNDPDRPNPSQTWYDSGQVPQSKKFPFGAAIGDEQTDPETRHNPQVDEYGQDAGNSQNFAPPQQQGGQNQQYGDPHQPRRADHPTGEQPPHGQSGQQGQFPGDQRQSPQPQQNQGQYPPQSGQPQGQYPPQSGHPQGQYPPQSGQPQGQYPPQGGQPQGSQPQSGQPQGQYQPQSGPPQGSQPQNGGYGPQGSNGPNDQQQYNHQGQGQRNMNSQSQQPVNEAPVSGDPGNQQFHGILDPHTGEIHPVPDLEGLQDTDALLVVVSGPDSGSQILLDTDVVTVGRSPNADIFLDDVTVSRKHAEFIRTPSGFTLRDTGSLNGTYVGRQLIDSIELQNGADLQIGKFRMIFQQRPRS